MFDKSIWRAKFPVQGGTLRTALHVALLFSTIFSQLAQSQGADAAAESRAKYWAEKGYSFDPTFMTPSMMDSRVKAFERAKYWEARGYSFDANYMTPSMMDARVKAFERAEYWEGKGYSFDANYMTPSMMDARVKAFERAEYWEGKGYSFDANFMTPSMMDARVEAYERAQYWEAKGYNFDPNAMTPSMMDRSVENQKRRPADGVVSNAGDMAARGSVQPFQASDNVVQAASPSSNGQVRTIVSIDQYVLALQTALVTLGYDPGPLDGVLGPRTDSAVRQFQLDCKLQADGAAGEETRHTLGDKLLESSGGEVSAETGIGTASQWKTREELRNYLVDYKGKIVPRVAENGSQYGETSLETGRPKVVHVGGYYRKDGTYVRGHYRSRPR